MFEPFSSGYYLGRLYVEPTDEGRPAIQRTQHERVNERLYATGEGVERLDAPLVMKLGQTYLAVHGSDAVAEGTLAVPAETLEHIHIDDPPTLSEVLLAKAEHAQRLVSYGAV